MTTTLSTPLVRPETLDRIAERAGALDRGHETTQDVFPELGQQQVLALGAPHNADGGLPAMAELVQQVAARCMSTAFSLWATRVTIEYLLASGAELGARYAAELASGERLGITGMASAFKDLSGCGELDLQATPTDDGLVLDGTLRWASNLFDDSILVTAARTADGQKVVVALPLDTPGITVGKGFELLALGSTSSSFVKLEQVRVREEQVLTRDVTTFLTGIRPTFLVLQSAMCLGLAGASLEAAAQGLAGVNDSFSDEVSAVRERQQQTVATLTGIAERVGTTTPPQRVELLELRLAAAEIATAAAGLEVRTAGGKGYARSTPASRRFREATFIPVQSPSEGQLRWELANNN
ncbi:hypothetical protein ACTQ49_03100 [Luteococcus sp. Sow4_B9]|uniref:hypothetical protein n=1 Tax=Luteococcus sp. Sow4_B9 TaxID=3438792 RepID=UPI003F9A5DFD